LSPAAALLIPFFAIPLGLLARNSFYRDDPITGGIVPDLTLANYVTVLSDAYYLRVFSNTLLSALGVAILALAISYPFAWSLARAAGRTRSLLVWCVYMPIYASVIMRVFGWMIILGDSGALNQALLSWGLLGSPLRLMGEPVGMAVGLLHRYLPLMIIPLATALGKIDDSLLKASENLGARRAHTWTRVILPISIPGAMAGGQLVFAAVLSDYVVPVMMGTSRFQLLAPAIFYEATTNASWALAGAMGTAVLLCVVVFLLTVNLAMRRLFPWSAL
jgi:putative spermidine/putrescine transport system permease protein